MEIAFNSASDHHFASVVALNSQLSIPPANIDDEDLKEHYVVVSRPEDEHTVSRPC